MSVSALIPIYILVLVGFALVKSGYVPEGTIRPANLLVVKVFVPVVIFMALFRVSGGDDYNFRFIIGYGLASLTGVFIIFGGLHKFFGFSIAKSALLSLAGGGSNSIFIGFPLVLILFPHFADMSLSWVLIVENVALIPLCLLLYDLFAEGEKNTRKIIMNFLSNPILLAIIAGIITPHFITSLWGPLEQALSMMRVATPGFALVLVGGMLARSNLGGHLAAVSWVAIGKLFFHPLLTMLICLALGIKGEILLIAISYASVSAFGIYANFCEMAEEGEFGASVFFLTTLIAPISISAWLAFASKL